MIDHATYQYSAGRGLDVIAEPEVRRLADYWISKRGGRPMPARRDFDPTEIPWALSRFFLVDYDRATETYRYRVAGEEIERVFARFSGSTSMRGVTLEEMLPASSVEVVRKRWRPLVDRGDLVYMSGLIYIAAERIPIGGRIMLPLSESGDTTVTGMVGFTVCDWRRPSELARQPDLTVTYIPLDEVQGHGGVAPACRCA